MFSLLEFEQVFLAVVGHDAKCLVLEHVPIDVTYQDLVQHDLKVGCLIRRIHDRDDLQLQRARIGEGPVMLQQHQAGVLALGRDPLDDLLDLVKVTAELGAVLLHLAEIVQLAELPDDRFILTLGLF